MAASKKEAKRLAAGHALRVIGQTDDTQTMDSTSSAASRVESAAATFKNPVLVLHRAYPDAQYSLVSERGASHTKHFIMALVVEGRKFYGSGYNKLMAKACAAQAALYELHGVVCFASPGKSSSHACL